MLAVINVLLLPVTTALAEDGLYLGCGVNGIENKFGAIIDVATVVQIVATTFVPGLYETMCGMCFPTL